MFTETTLIVRVDKESVDERDLPLLPAQPALGLVEQALDLAMLARDTGHGDARTLPDVVVVHLRNGRTDPPRELRLRRAQVHPLLLQRVRLGKVELAREDPDPAARHIPIQTEYAPPVGDPPARLDDETVRDFVAKAHGDVEYVRAALGAVPTLVNAAWDWGGGDWETALGAAGHMGRRDIAELLLTHGARLDVFVAAMLGDVETVRAILSAHPEAKDALGPHGIPLRAHAEAGGEQAFAVLELLDSAG